MTTLSQILRQLSKHTYPSGFIEVDPVEAEKVLGQSIVTLMKENADLSEKLKIAGEALSCALITLRDCGTEDDTFRLDIETTIEHIESALSPSKS